jgi:hypothetical protein
MSSCKSRMRSSRADGNSTWESRDKANSSMRANSESSIPLRAARSDNSSISLCVKLPSEAAITTKLRKSSRSFIQSPLRENCDSIIGLA